MKLTFFSANTWSLVAFFSISFLCSLFLFSCDFFHKLVFLYLICRHLSWVIFFLSSLSLFALISSLMLEMHFTTTLDFNYIFFHVLSTHILLLFIFFFFFSWHPSQLGTPQKNFDWEWWCFMQMKTSFILNTIKNFLQESIKEDKR